MDAAKEQEMRCPTCGSTEVYRSKRRAFERAFNWVFWYQQRPYRCATCMTRYWKKLEPRVWRRTLRVRGAKLLRAWGLYFGALVLAALVAWTMIYVQQQSLKDNLLIDTAIEQEMIKRLDETDLNSDQKERAREFFNENRDRLPIPK